MENNLIWSYTLSRKERSLELSKRVLNKRYLDKQVRVINAYKDNLNDLKTIMENMYLVSNIDLDRIQILQTNLKDINCVKAFVNEYKLYTHKLGFSPFIIGGVKNV